MTEASPRRLPASGDMTAQEGAIGPMLSHNARSAHTQLQRELDRAECCNPRCEAKPDPDMKIPLCDTCARGVYRDVSATMLSAVRHGTPRQTRDIAGVVYFILLGDRIKIGYTTDLDARMRVIPHEEVLGTIPGTMRDERMYHAKFAKHRTTGEWFKDCPDIRDYIRAHKAA